MPRPAPSSMPPLPDARSGEAVSITENVTTAPSPIDMREYLAGAADAASPVPISPGTQSVSVDVTVVFGLK